MACGDSILEEITELSLEGQEMVDEIVHKRIIEGKRAEIQADFQAALEERKQGRTNCPAPRGPSPD